MSQALTTLLVNPIEPPIIPTRWKSKIPRTLSWPVGAKTVSDALIGVPQFDELSLDFWFWNQHSLQHGTATPYRVLQVQFSGRRRSFSASESGDEQHKPERWKISVSAVPRTLRHVIQTKIVAEALPVVRAWLLANHHSNEREGGHGLAFFFDEPKGELTHNEHASMEWQTERNGR